MATRIRVLHRLDPGERRIGASGKVTFFCSPHPFRGQVEVSRSGDLCQDFRTWLCSAFFGGSNHLYVILDCRSACPSQHAQ